MGRTRVDRRAQVGPRARPPGGRVCVGAAHALALVLSATAAYAQGGPPLITEDPFTPRPWHWEVSGAWETDAGSAAATHDLPALDLSFGLGSRIELAAEVAYRWASRDGANDDAFGNVLAGMKYRFADRVHGWAISTYPQVRFPVGRRHASRLESDSLLAALIAVEAAHSHGRFECAGEVGYSLGARAVRQATYGIVVGWVVSERLELLSECNGQGDRPMAPDQLVCGLGLRHEISQYFGLMGAFEPVVAGNDPDRPRYHVYLGAQTHVRGGGFWKGARRALIGK